MLKITTVKRYIRYLEELIAYHTIGLSRFIASVLCVWLFLHLTSSNKDPFNVFMAFFVVGVTFPVLFLIFSVFAFGLKIICLMLINFQDYREAKKAESGYYRESDFSYGRYNSEHEQTHHSSYSRNSGASDFARDYEKWYYEQQEKETQNKQQETNDSAAKEEPQDELKKAMAFYHVSFPFTEEEIRAKRKQLMKTAHPDIGGTEEEAKKINIYFDILSKYAN